MIKKKAPRSSKPSPNQKENNYLRFTSVVFEVTAFNLVCIWGGYKLSQLYSPELHIFLLVGVFLGISGTIYLLLKRLSDH